jgi:hypothetical protein
MSLRPPPPAAEPERKLVEVPGDLGEVGAPAAGQVLRRAGVRELLEIVRAAALQSRAPALQPGIQVGEQVALSDRGGGAYPIGD